MVKHFEKDSDSEVTALSNLNIATFLQRPEGLVFGRKEGKTGRLGVLTGFAHEHRERGHKVIAKASMKQTIQDWIANAGQGNINNMTLVLTGIQDAVRNTTTRDKPVEWALDDEPR
jgi:hypothetical protein